MKKVLIFSISFLFAFILGSLLRQPYKTTLKLNQSIIFIERDSLNVASINAPTFESALYAWGYVSAEDRLFQMAFKRLIGQGRISQFLGVSTIKVDRFFREINLKHWATRMVQRLKRQNAIQYNNLNRYVEGINAAAHNFKLLPLDFHLIGLNWQPWQLEDTFLLYLMFQWSQAGNAGEEYIRSNLLQNLTKEQIDVILPYQQQNWFINDRQVTIVEDREIPPTEQQQPKIFSPFQPSVVKEMLKVGLLDYIGSDSGSNSWVIGGQHTASGHPILANDPHLDSTLPSQWLLVKITYYFNHKAVNLTIASMVGAPIFVGKSGYVAIGITTHYGDVQDLYKQTVQGGKYLLDGEWIPLKNRTEMIQIKDQPSQHYLVSETHRGPLLHYLSHAGSLYQLPTQHISLLWVGFQDDVSPLIGYTHLAEINTFQSLMNFINSNTSTAPNLNLVFATQDDHIGYQLLGRYPIRNHPNDGMYVKDGSTTRYDWRGFIPSAKRVSLIDPQRGYIVTANNKPKQGQPGIYTARALRLTTLIQTLIGNGSKVTVDHTIIMQTDLTDVYCKELLPYILNSLNSTSLVGFDCVFDSDSHQATIYEVFMDFLAHRLNPKPSSQFRLLNLHGYLSYVQRELVSNAQPHFLQEVMESTEKYLSGFFATNDMSQWKWGTLHRDYLNHRPFGSVPLLQHFYTREFEGCGNIHTVNVGKMNKVERNSFRTTHRANLRIIMSFHEQGVWITDGGSSELVYSKHYTDQMELYKRNQYLLYSSGEVHGERINDQEL